MNKGLLVSGQKPLFSLGQVVATPAALSALADARANGLQLLERHLRGDWGDVDTADWQANQSALASGERLLSVYPLSTGVRLWIITEAVGDNGERASTCMLLPQDY